MLLYFLLLYMNLYVIFVCLFKNMLNFIIFVKGELNIEGLFFFEYY